MPRRHAKHIATASDRCAQKRQHHQKERKILRMGLSLGSVGSNCSKIGDLCRTSVRVLSGAQASEALWRRAQCKCQEAHGANRLRGNASSHTVPSPHNSRSSRSLFGRKSSMVFWKQHVGVCGLDGLLGLVLALPPAEPANLCRTGIEQAAVRVSRGTCSAPAHPTHDLYGLYGSKCLGISIYTAASTVSHVWLQLVLET